MAISGVVFSTISSCKLFSRIPRQSFIPTRNAVKSAARRRLPTKPVINPFVNKRTNFIKELCIALVKYDRIQTTFHKALQLKSYGELLIIMTRRKCPPPDLHYLEDGFILTDQEARERLTTKLVVNRRNKKIISQPQEFNEQEYVEQLQLQIRSILLEDEEALQKLYNKLVPRYEDRYGGFVKVTPIPYPVKRHYPRMAYVEFIDNDLPPIPKLPELTKGKLVTFPRLSS
ncbi:uncharacterized protein LOC114523443 [Dendronephthya gigantea]|uniref:uncharacterized protein LOC114523443 n=1 Tax=Dendronephthya gigantea TaxID=151771 RepID=UPI00106B248B|nr:uncharacterized protein LOC114523443 [Dendronephthya gigantea]